MLNIQPLYVQQIYQQAEKTYPEECCGLLLGLIEQNIGWVKEIYPTPNSWIASNDIESIDSHRHLSQTQQTLSRRNRFSIDPKQLLQIQKEARERQLNIIGVYHSHPEHEAIPSVFDQAIAWPEYYYIIVSVQQGKGKDILCWQLNDNHQFQSVEMVN